MDENDASLTSMDTEWRMMRYGDDRGFDLLGKIAVARTGPGDVYGEGEVIAYCAAPQVTIRRPDGTVFHWRVDMCEFVDPERAEYERLRAKFENR